MTGTFELNVASLLDMRRQISTAAREGVVGVFGKALVGLLSQRIASRLIGALI